MTGEEIMLSRGKQVIKANELIQKSSFNLSAQQQKIILYIISQIEKGDDDFKEYTFDLNDYCAVCGISKYNGTMLDELKKSIQEIADKSRWIKFDKYEALCRWIEKAKIYNKSNKVSIQLDSDLKPFLLKLKDNYTCYELIYVLHFKSKYSIRLYELIKSIHYNKEEEYSRRFEVEELKRLLGAENYQRFGDFNKVALAPAIKEINKYSDIELEALQIKSGKSVKYIQLDIIPKDNIKVELTRFKIGTEMTK